MKNIHIVNGNSAAGSLKFILKKENIDSVNEVFCFNDFLSTGPLFQIESDNGLQKRRSYISKLINKVNSNYPLNEIIDNISELKEINFSDCDRIIVWHGNNAPERLMKLLCCKFINNEKLFEVDISSFQIDKKTPRAVGECTPQTLLTLLNNGLKKISQEEYSENIKTWDKLTLTDSDLRILNQGNLENVSESFFDQLILEQCTNEFTPALKIVGKVLGKSKQLIGDTFIVYRLFHLIETKRMKHQGEMNNIRSLLVKKQNLEN